MRAADPSYGRDVQRIALASVLVLVLAAACGGTADEPPSSTPEPDDPSGRIAYNCGEEARQVCLIEADGTGAERVTGTALQVEAPAWDATGESVVVARVEGDAFRLYRLDLGSGAQEALTRPGRLAYYGRPSPDGTRLLFVCGDLEDSDLCIANADGTGVGVVVASPFHELDPAWSPDGTQIAFSRISDEQGPQVFLAAADGSGERSLAPGITPSWSPDGETIAVAGGALYRVDVESGRATPLTEGFDLEPSWSPDGRWIVFRRGELPDASLYLVRADGTDERRLTPPGEPAVLPSWSPTG